MVIADSQALLMGFRGWLQASGPQLHLHGLVATHLGDLLTLNHPTLPRKQLSEQRKQNGFV